MLYSSARQHEVLCSCSCSSRRNIWANRTALQFFNKNIQQFVALDYSGPVVGTVTKEDFAAFNALNSLVHEEVEVSRRHAGFRCTPFLVHWPVMLKGASCLATDSAHGATNQGALSTVAPCTSLPATWHSQLCSSISW